MWTIGVGEGLAGCTENNIFNVQTYNTSGPKKVSVKLQPSAALDFPIVAEK
jgi:hypothetical protein